MLIAEPRRIAAAHAIIEVDVEDQALPRADRPALFALLDDLDRPCQVTVIAVAVDALELDAGGRVFVVELGTNSPQKH